MLISMTNINENYREFKLDNGLLVALQETPTKTVSGRLRVWHGALNEDKGEDGIAHLLEHNLAMGESQKYDLKKSSQIRNSFGAFNAFTGQDRTFFPVDMLAEDSELFLDYISNLTFNPKFGAKTLEEERQRVLRETADTKSKPEFKDSRTYKEAFFGKNSPHTRVVLGNESVISSATIEDLKKFHERGYNPNNMDLILAGALPKNIEELVQKKFGSFQPGEGKRFEFPRNPKLQGSTILHTSAPELYNEDHPDQSSAQLTIGLFAPNRTDDDSYAATMLVELIGGELFEEVSQRKGLAYGIKAEHDCSDNQGGIYIQGSVHSLRANEAVDAIFEEMSKIRGSLVSQENLDGIKRNSKYQIAKAFETNAGHIQLIQSKIDRGFNLEDHFRKMDAVTPEKIRETAREYFPENHVNGKYVLSLRDPLKK